MSEPGEGDLCAQAEGIPQIPNIYAPPAVSPLAQGQGLGSALLAHHHAWLDYDGIPGYLEASKTRNRDLYLHHRYELREGFWLPDNGPQLWPMLRQPAS